MIATNINWKDWFQLLHDAVDALLKADGPYPAILVIFLFLFWATQVVITVTLIRAKDEEVKRATDSRDRLEGLLGTQHPSSTEKRKGKSK